MGIVSRRTLIEIAASWFDGVVQVRGSVTWGGARVRQHPIEWARDAGLRLVTFDSDGEHRARHKRAAAMAGVAL
jgi:hypothetical protein